jgi:TatD DNase family protein
MAIELVDTHCHIQSAGALNNGERSTLEKWQKHPDRTIDAIVQSATEAGVKRMVLVGCDLKDSELAISQVQKRPECFASIGLHPHEAKKSLENGHLDAFAALVTRPKVMAVGECGLDYYYEHSPREAQIEVLKFQIELALKHDKPMIFHVRDAFEDFWPIFDSYKGIRGVLHSFTDSEENLVQAMERGLYIGVNGIATFAKEPAQLEMYKKIPLSRLLLETDAPFLTPSPYRGTICEPYHIKVIAEFLGGLRGEALSDLASATTENSARLFRI